MHFFVSFRTNRYVFRFSINLKPFEILVLYDNVVRASWMEPSMTITTIMNLFMSAELLFLSIDAILYVYSADRQ